MSSATNPSLPSPLHLEGGDKNRSSARLQSGYESRDALTTVDKHPAPFNTTPVEFYPPSPQFDGSEDDLTAALIHPDMSFNTVADLNASRIPLPAQPVPYSPVQASKTSRSSTTASTLSERRDTAPEMMSMFTSYVPPCMRYTASQIAQWRAEEEYYKEKIKEELGGKEICLTRYEARQGWLGFWNRENVFDIIDDLRKLRSPES
jgi:hypothetical protein